MRLKRMKQALALIGLLHIAVPLQAAPQSGDSLLVTVNNPSIDSSLVIRGRRAGFPNPVLTRFSVLDAQGFPVTGLADTARWLGPDDMSENGRPIREIWPSLREVHKNQPDLPANPDLYQLGSGPWFTEFRSDTRYPSSSMLVMDLSQSMIPVIDSVRIAAKSFVDNLRPVDRGAVIQFATDIIKVQEFTRWQGALKSAIDFGQARGYTALYDALALAIRMTAAESLPRKAIVAYTDGGDNRSQSYTIDSVIDSAQAAAIPIFVIGLGDSVDVAAMQRLSQETGGAFFSCATPEQMTELYLRISRIIQNFYVMAHQSPDSELNGTTRLVQIGVNHAGIDGSGSGQYDVPGSPPLPAYDLSVGLQLAAHSQLDNSPSVYTDSLHQYQLTVRNAGPATATDAQLRMAIPEDVNLISVSLPPASTDSTDRLWQLPELAAGDSLSILLDASIPELGRSAPFPMTLNASVSAERDSNLVNNNTNLSFIVSPWPDVAVSLSSRAPGGTTGVAPGDTVSFLATVSNERTVTAHDIELSLIPASGLQLLTGETATTVFIDSLAGGAEASLPFQAYLPEDTDIEDGAVLASQARITAALDRLPENNSTVDTLFVSKAGVSQKTDLALEFSLRADSTSLLDGEQVPAGLPGSSVDIALFVKNHGPEDVASFDLSLILPEGLSATNSDEDSLVWTGSELSVGDSSTISIQATIGKNFDSYPWQLPVSAALAAEQDSTSENNSANAVVLALSPARMQPGKTDLSLTLMLRADSTSLQNGEQIPAGLPGSQIDLDLLVKNNGPEDVATFSLSLAFPDGLSATTSDEDTLTWTGSELASGDSSTFAIQAKIADAFDSYPWSLPVSATLASEQDSTAENNSAQALVLALAPPITLPAATDVAASVQIIAADSTLSGGRYVPAARSGDIVWVKVGAKNLSEVAADSVNILLNLTGPPTGTFEPYSLDVGRLAAGALVSDSVSYQIPDVDNLPEWIGAGLTVFAARDSNTANNMAIDSLFVQRGTHSGKDLALRTSIIADTAVGGIPAVAENGIYRFGIEVWSAGGETVDSFTLQANLPTASDTIACSLTPGSAADNQLFWELGPLAPGDSLQLYLDLEIGALDPDQKSLQHYTEIILAQDDNPADNFAFDSLLVLHGVTALDADVSISLTAQTDSTARSISGETLRFVRANERFRYVLGYHNNSNAFARSIDLAHELPEQVTLDGGTLPAGAVQVNPGTLTWQMPALAPGESGLITVRAQAPSSFPQGVTELRSSASIAAANEPAEWRDDNSAAVSIFHSTRRDGEPQPLPEIRAEPSEVQVGDSVIVTVRTPITVKRWDIVVRSADNRIDSSFADAQIARTQLQPGLWLRLDQEYRDVRLLTSARQEQLIFEIITTDLLGNIASASAAVTVRSQNAFVLEKNMFKPDIEGDFGIRFKLSSNRIARLDLYDIAGSHIGKLTEQPFIAGWNDYRWDGKTAEGQVVGSGVYLVTVRSEELHSWKKMILVR